MFFSVNLNNTFFSIILVWMFTSAK
jgi:hypothetical protein